MLDYAQQSDGDLNFSSGDIASTESTYQHQRDLLLSAKGHIRSKGEAGVGVLEYMIDSDTEDLLRETRLQFASDGMKVSSLSFDTTTNDLNSVAAYE
ncbi:MAG: hypothetical protein SNJ29_07245 [Rikenellaceae bacterium]